MLRRYPLLLLCLLSTAALAQDDAMAEDAIAEPVTRSLEGLHQMTSANIVKTAEMLDDAMYAYRPTDDVRTAGQMLGHIANAQYVFCSTAAGEPSPNAVDIETSGASLTAA